MISESGSENHSLANQAIPAETTRHEVFFALDSGHIKQIDLDVIDEITETYQPGQTIALTGWADAKIATGTSSDAGKVYNLALADTRARAVKAVLIERGIPASKIVVSAQVSSKVDNYARRVDMVIE